MLLEQVAVFQVGEILHWMTVRLSEALRHVAPGIASECAMTFLLLHRIVL